MPHCPLMRRQIGAWDAFMQQEAAAIWVTRCAPCHGISGRGENVTQQFETPPRAFGSFGMKMGFFFGRNRMRAGLYRRVALGSAADPNKPGSMPSFEGQLTREQMWAVVTYLESL